MSSGTDSEAAPGRRRWRRLLSYVIAAAAIALAVFLLHRTLSQYEWRELVEAVTSVPGWRVAVAIGFAAASYLCLTGFDWLALVYAGHRLAYRHAALASFTSLSIGHNIGFAALSSGAIRYRFYSRWGLGAAEIATVIVFCGLTVGLGLSILGGIALLWRPDFAAGVGVPPASATAVAVVCLAWPAAYLLLAATLRRRLEFRGRCLQLPGLPLALGQIAVGTANFAMVAAALHQSVSALADVSYVEVASVYVIANVATLITHVPGGAGVVESVVLFLLPHAELIGAVLVFRFVYFLLPLALGSITLLATEIYRTRSRPAPASKGQADRSLCHHARKRSTNANGRSGSSRRVPGNE